MTSSPKIADTTAFNITPISDRDISQKVPGYYLKSTAPINVEEHPWPSDKTSVEKQIQEIASHLLQSKNPQLIISIHGYANQESDANKRYQEIHKYANALGLSNSVFVGYRWPAENPGRDDPEPGSNKPISFGDKIKFAFQSLPTLVLGILISTLVLGIITIFLLLAKSTLPLAVTFLVIGLVSIALSLVLTNLGSAQKFLPIFPNGIILVLLAFVIGVIAILSPINLDALLVLLAVVFVLVLGIVLALMALRLSTYPRDRFRATNYGVIDLVEFIRQLDKAVIKQAFKQIEIPDHEKDSNIDIDDPKIKKNRVKLSFIAHSLGCEVVTQTIRILSDVFDPESIDKADQIKNPSPAIGHVFSLERLILVAPDIPIESILSGRANFLKASL
ncbi:MAG: hypothetical protein ACRDEA_02295, partial [Microcystaceae cyanobacterium]